jgi:5'-nucleotidase
MPPRVLITNDDGIESEGLRWLARTAVDLGFDTVVAAPLTDSSGTSASLIATQADGRIVVEERALPGLTGVPAFGVAAAPGFIALIATRGAFGTPPDIVLSGINRGVNTGHAVLHSGTVGAAMTARTQGCRAMAVSLADGEHQHWSTAAEIAGRAVKVLLELDREREVVLNLNVPNVAIEDIRGVRRANLASFGAVQTSIEEVGSGWLRVGIADEDRSIEPGTDTALLAEGYASLTALQSLAVADDVELNV